MKKHEVRRLEGLLEGLCQHLRDQPYALHNLETLLLGCIDLARTGKAWKATTIALEASSFLTSALDRAKFDSAKSQNAQKPWWVQPRVDLNRPPVATGYDQVKCEPPRPAATVEQMQAAADAAMKDNIGWFVCTGCGKKTATADGKKPLAWVFNAEVDGEVYKALCATCFGVGIPTDCDYCGSTEPGTNDGGWWRFTAKNSITGKYEPRVSCDNCYDSVKDAEDEEP